MSDLVLQYFLVYVGIGSSVSGVLTAQLQHNGGYVLHAVYEELSGLEEVIICSRFSMTKCWSGGKL
jgi:hypothetical protein